MLWATLKSIHIQRVRAWLTMSGHRQVTHSGFKLEAFPASVPVDNVPDSREIIRWIYLSVCLTMCEHDDWNSCGRYERNFNGRQHNGLRKSIKLRAPAPMGEGFPQNVCWYSIKLIMFDVDQPNLARQVSTVVGEMQKFLRGRSRPLPVSCAHRSGCLSCFQSLSGRCALMSALLVYCKRQVDVLQTVLWSETVVLWQDRSQTSAGLGLAVSVLVLVLVWTFWSCF